MVVSVLQAQEIELDQADLLHAAHVELRDGVRFESAGSR